MIPADQRGQVLRHAVRPIQPAARGAGLVQLLPLQRAKLDLDSLHAHRLQPLPVPLLPDRFRASLLSVTRHALFLFAFSN
ncbi:hypothetical protein D3C78_1686840 [compost metagenome]